METKDTKSESLTIRPYQIIGLDKLELKNLFVWNLDIDYLTKLKNVKIRTTAKAGRLPWDMPDGQGISQIKIADNEIFSDLVIGYSEKCGNVYVYLTLTIPKAKGNNLEPFTYAEYDANIRAVAAYIASEYHITLGLDNMKVKSIEINTNIPLKYDFSAYDNPLRLLKTFFNRLGKLYTFESCSDGELRGESYKRGNKSYDVVFYDKTKELKDTGKDYDNLDISILRIEYRLKTTQAVKRILGSEFWSELNDEIISDYFKEKIDKLEKAFSEWQKVRHKNLRDMITKLRKENKNNWHWQLMREIENRSLKEGIPFILDVEQIYDAIDSFKEKNSTRRRKMIESTETKMTKDVLFNHDLCKIREIFDGVAEAYNNTLSKGTLSE